MRTRVLGVLFTVTALVGAGVAYQVTAASAEELAAAAAPVELPNPGQLGLRPDFTSLARGLNALADADSSALRPVTVATVVDSANRTGRPRASCRREVTGIVASFCWESGPGEDDGDTKAWYPQGVTSTADAAAGGSYAGRQALVVSWYDRAADRVAKGVRLSFTDWSRPERPRYRHVLLVEPATSTVQGRTVGDFRALGRVRADGKEENVHAGGVFWFGHLVYVADTYAGVRVFDTRRIYRVDRTADRNRIGRFTATDGSTRYAAFGYEYVMPQVGGYAPSGRFRYSFLGLDRTVKPPAMVAGEYHQNDPGRLARWQLDSGSDRLVTAADGVARAVRLYDTGVRQLQGAVSLHGRYYLATSNGRDPGCLRSWTPGQNQVRATKWALGAEALSYWPGSRQLWSLTEKPGKRTVFAVSEPKIRASAC